MIRRGVGIALALLILLPTLGGCPPSKVIVPQLAENAADVRTPGKFVWYDLFTADMTASTNFYEALFGWDIDRTNDTDPSVKTVFDKGRAIANVIGRESTPGDSQWIPYLSVNDTDAALGIAESAGGTIHKTSREIDNRGMVGIAIDPQGAPFAVVSSSTGDPLDGTVRTGRWLSPELWTTDVDAAVAFYSRFANYKDQSIPIKGQPGYRVLVTNTRVRAGFIAIPWQDVTPQWIPFVAVENVLATVTRAQALEGTLLIAPDMASKEGRVAIIADPSGAVFGVQEFK